MLGLWGRGIGKEVQCFDFLRLSNHRPNGFLNDCRLDISPRLDVDRVSAAKQANVPNRSLHAGRHIDVGSETPVAGGKV